jgi:hypothetical protein
VHHAQNISALELDPRDKLWKVVGGCANISALPNITFIIGNHKFPLRPDQYVMQARARLNWHLPPVLAHWEPLTVGLQGVPLMPCSPPGSTPCSIKTAARLKTDSVRKVVPVITGTICRMRHAWKHACRSVHEGMAVSMSGHVMLTATLLAR